MTRWVMARGLLDSLRQIIPRKPSGEGADTRTEGLLHLAWPTVNMILRAQDT